MGRLAALALIAAAVAAFFLLRGSDEDQLSWSVPNERNAPHPTSESRAFLAAVSIGCNGDPAKFGPERYSVEKERWAFIVTFEGEEFENGDDCLTTEESTVRLPEPLGARALCDGSNDPPVQVFPEANGDRPPNGPCVFRFYGEDAPRYSYGL